jgi:propionyl-CoA carboxylase alpha chain
MLVNVLRHEAFLSGDTDTAFLERHRADTVTAPLADAAAHQASAIAATLAQAATNRTTAHVNRHLPSGWRNVPSAPQRRRFRAGDTEYEVAYRAVRDRYIIDSASDALEILEATPDRVVLRIGSLRRTFTISRYPDLICIDSPLGPVTLVPLPRFTEPSHALALGSLTAQMPGTVLRIAATVGQHVAAGEPLLWLEAMKMQHAITAPAAGQVSELPVTVGQQVDQGAVLAVITPQELQ